MNNLRSHVNMEGLKMTIKICADLNLTPLKIQVRSITDSANWLGDMTLYRTEVKLFYLI